MYPPQFTISSTQLKECFKIHPLYDLITKNKGCHAHKLLKFIENSMISITIKQTKEFETILQNLIQLNTNSSDCNIHIITLYNKLANYKDSYIQFQNSHHSKILE